MYPEILHFSSYNSVVSKFAVFNGHFKELLAFRGLNLVIQGPTFAFIDRLNGNQYFTIVDMENAYYHIPIREEYRHKSGINKPFGIYLYNRSRLYVYENNK
jgi:hypothetical protein